MVFLLFEPTTLCLTVSKFLLHSVIVANQSIGMPCDRFGDNIQKGTPPPDPYSNLPPPGNWMPYNNRSEFELADLLFTHQQMSIKGINELLKIWEASGIPFDCPPPFTNVAYLYETIDSTPYGDISWNSFTKHYNLHNDPPSNEAPAAWKTVDYEG